MTLVAVALGAFSRSKLGPMTVAAFAAGTAILIPPSRRLAIRDQLGAIIAACRRGAAFRDGDAFARASAVRTAIFCVRGTVVTKGPDACDIEVAGDARRATAADVLALAACPGGGFLHALINRLQTFRGRISHAKAPGAGDRFP